MIIINGLLLQLCCIQWWLWDSNQLPCCDFPTTANSYNEITFNSKIQGSKSIGNWSHYMGG